MSDNETLADRVARTFAKAPAATRDTITQRLTAAWWDNMHVAFEDDNGQWRQALALASEGLDMGAKPPPTPEDIAATLEAEAIAHVERVMGKRFRRYPAAYAPCHACRGATNYFGSARRTAYVGGTRSSRD